jgi:hypothetical protein
VAHVTADRIRDTTTTTGTGVLTVSGTAPSGYRTFSAVMTTNDTCFYALQHQSAAEWEVGLGTYSGSNQLTRTTVLASSNANSAVNLTAGTKDIFITLAASKTVQQDNAGNVRIEGAGKFGLKSAGGGFFNLVPASSASSFDFTLPARTSTIATLGPTVSAYNSTTQSISATTLTKVSFQTEVVDSDGTFASSTFTPNVAGYYFIDATIYGSGAGCQWQALIYKNGSAVLSAPYLWGIGAHASSIFYCNGSTDYIEVYAFLEEARTLASAACFFNAFFVRP